MRNENQLVKIENPNLEKSWLNDDCKWLHEINGPWNNEPDKIQWKDEKTGLPCLIVRHEESGHLCGYVGIAKDHTLYEIDYDNCPNFDVHWGLTYSNKCQELGDESKGVCHTPEPGEPDDIWWLGFDAAHCEDICPKTFLRYPDNIFIGSTYKDVHFMRNECKKLAEQLHGII